MNKRLIIITAIILFALILPVSSIAAEYRVVIDPGHGGNDKGVKVSFRTYEKDITLAIAKLVNTQLNKEKDIKVRLTRLTDRDLTIEERQRVARNYDTDLFISLHINAAFGDTASGYEVYFPGFKKSSTGPGNNSSDLYLSNTVKFAQIFQKKIERIFPRQGRGLRNAPMTVLEGLEMSAVVLEIAFSTNSDNRKKLKNRKNQESIADALSSSIKEYFKDLGARE